MADVIIVGAGPAGALAAAILAREGLQVRVFDRARFPRDKLCGDTLNPGALAVLAEHMPVDAIVARGVPLDGMLLTGPRGVEVHGRYGPGVIGRSLSRRELDVILIDRAIAAGARVEEGAAVAGTITDAAATVTGVTVKTNGRTCHERARIVIAADGRASCLARGSRLARHPTRPRRWAIGSYFSGVEGLTRLGEMHVRRGRYFGLAPMPDGLANGCLVVPERTARETWSDPAAMLTDAIKSDSMLAPRFERAEMIAPPRVLGPMAVDSDAPGVPGLLLAGDAAGFIDPMTGDGLRLALSSAALAASVALSVLRGEASQAQAVARLAAVRRAAFAPKWRFNRSLRALVGSETLLGGATLAARVLPAAFEAIIRYAGDCGTARPRPS